MSTLINPPLVAPTLAVREPAPDPLEPVSRVEDQIASSPTTPGLHVPGAFPGPQPQFDVVQRDTEYVKDAAINALQTAKGYVPTSVEDMKHLIENASDTVGGYLPQSVVAYLFLPFFTTAGTSLLSEPNSRNVAGTHPVHHTTNMSLPSEETSQNIYPDSSRADILLGPLDDGPNSETLCSETGIAILPEERRQFHLPSHDDDPPFATETGESLSTCGVGALPGDKGEVGVARLPEERQSPVGFVSGASTDASTSLLRPEVQDPDISQHVLPASGSTSFTPFPIRKSTTASSTHASRPIAPNDTARTYPPASDGVKLKGVPLSPRFQKELDEEQSSPSEKYIHERQNLEHGQSDEAVGPGLPAGHEAVRKKLGFMDKLKGEVKVISGKLSHKESKVEEGKRMMGKT